MRKKVVLLLLSLCLLFSLPVVSYAADGDVYVEVGSEQALDSFKESLTDQYVAYLDDSGSAYEVSAVQNDASGTAAASFIPELSVSGNVYDYNSELYLWMQTPLVTSGAFYQPYQSDHTKPVMPTKYSLSTFNKQTLTVVLSGFDSDSTYNGVAYFQLSVPNYAVDTGVTPLLPSGFSPSGGYDFIKLTNIGPTSIRALNGEGYDMPCYFSVSPDSTGSSYIYTFYVVLQDYYVGPENGVVDVDNVTVNIDLVQGYLIEYTFYEEDTYDIPLSYYGTMISGCRFYSRSFSGTVEVGQHNFQSDLSESQNEELMNGYENEAGSSDISSGGEAVESGVAVEHDALGSAGDMAETFDYSGGDLTELAAAFSLISGWFTALVAALGTWNMLIYVSLTMVVALFAIGYFRNK